MNYDDQCAGTAGFDKRVSHSFTVAPPSQRHRLVVTQHTKHAHHHAHHHHKHPKHAMNTLPVDSEDSTAPLTGGQDDRYNAKGRVYASEPLERMHGRSSDHSTRMDQAPFAKGERVVPIACCGLLLVFVMTATVATIAVFLAQDSHAMAELNVRLTAYLDTFDKSGTMQNLKQINVDYEQRLRETILQASDSVRKANLLVSDIVTTTNHAGLVQEIREFAVEYRQWMARIDHLLNHTALHLNINL
ncbi:MAG: hypothetical protein JKY23_00410 [Nitrospinaceae bacterium]|nr:hypothetical protein [Nitrospinaceae bacterium]